MENVKWAVGRRKKFWEESGFVNVRVPKSKVSEYRDAIKKLVDEKFNRDNDELHRDEEDKAHLEKEKVTFRDFRDFVKDVEEEPSKTGDEDDFFTKIVKVVDNRGKNGKEIKYEP